MIHTDNNEGVEVMGMRDFFRRGESESELDKPKKTQDQLKAIVERRRAVVDSATALPEGKILIAIPPGMEHPDTAENIAIKKRSEIVYTNTQDSFSVQRGEYEMMTNISFETKELTEREDGGIVTTTSQVPLYSIGAGKVVDFKSDTKGIPMTDVDTPDFIELETILTHAAIQASMDAANTNNEEQV